jgi:hypothetical protein
MSGRSVVSGAFRLEPAVTQPIERDAIYRRRRFPRDVIDTCVRWYLTYRLSYRDLVALMAERDVHPNPYNGHAMGLSIRARIREEMERPGEAGWFLLAG